ncbi:hypothetical protein Emed_006343 [Eimeria media]
MSSDDKGGAHSPEGPLSAKQKAAIQYAAFSGKPHAAAAAAADGCAAAAASDCTCGVCASDEEKLALLDEKVQQLTRQIEQQAEVRGAPTDLLLVQLRDHLEAAKQAYLEGRYLEETEKRMQQQQQQQKQKQEDHQQQEQHDTTGLKGPESVQKVCCPPAAAAAAAAAAEGAAGQKALCLSGSCGAAVAAARLLLLLLLFIKADKGPKEVCLSQGPQGPHKVTSAPTAWEQGAAAPPAAVAVAFSAAAASAGAAAAASSATAAACASAVAQKETPETKQQEQQEQQQKQETAGSDQQQQQDEAPPASGAAAPEAPEQQQQQQQQQQEQLATPSDQPQEAQQQQQQQQDQDPSAAGAAASAATDPDAAAAAAAADAAAEDAPEPAPAAAASFQFKLERGPSDLPVWLQYNSRGSFCCSSSHDGAGGPERGSSAGAAGERGPLKDDLLLRRGCAVCVRIRPESLEEAQTGAPCCIDLLPPPVAAGGGPLASEGPQDLIVRGLRQQLHRFSFFRVFGETASQGEVYSVSCLPIVRCLFDGLSGAVIAYGQTGSGKTYTMLGPLDQPGGPAEYLGGGPLPPLTKAQKALYESRRGTAAPRGSIRPQQTIREQQLRGRPSVQGREATGGAGGRDSRRSVSEGPPVREDGGWGPPSGKGLLPLGDTDADGDSLLRRHSAQVTDMRGLMPRVLEELFRSIDNLKCESSANYGGPSFNIAWRDDGGCTLYCRGRCPLLCCPFFSPLFCLILYLSPSPSLLLSPSPLLSHNCLCLVLSPLSLLFSLVVLRLHHKPPPHLSPLWGRACGATAANAASSRSHAVLSLTLQQQRRSQGRIAVSYLNLVDLAGSERGDAAAEGRRLQETQSINKSLLALGNVVNALAGGPPRGPSAASRGGPAEGGATGGGLQAGPGGPGAPRRRHVPYRESKLTRLLRTSLGGSALAVLIICCSPHSRNLQETLSALRFGDRASRIENKPAAQDRVSVAALRDQLKDTTQALRMYEACLRSLRVAVGQQQQAICVLQHLVPEGAPVSSEDIYLLRAAKAAAKEAILADAAAHLPGAPRLLAGTDLGAPRNSTAGAPLRAAPGGGPPSPPGPTRPTPAAAVAARDSSRRTQSSPAPRRSISRGDKEGPLSQTNPGRGPPRAATPGPPGAPFGPPRRPPQNPRNSQAAAAAARGAAAVAAARRKKELEEQQRKNREASWRAAAARQAMRASGAASPETAAAATAAETQQHQAATAAPLEREDPSVVWLPQAKEAQGAPEVP